jgi:UDP-N-acetylmuramate dehydrogenase
MFFSVTSLDELLAAIRFSKKESLPFFILGGGSNTLFSDNGFAGVVINVALMGVTFEEVETDVVRATVAAGEDWDQLVAATVTKGLHGLENLSYIPGSVGGAVVQNIGAYGVEIKSCVESVEKSILRGIISY